jgi:regulatory protein YycI of two-component signal transduction system YycFG
MSLYQSVEEFKQQADADYKKYLTNFIYKGFLNIFPDYDNDYQIAVISELLFLAIQQDENSATVNYFKRIIEYSNTVIDKQLRTQRVKNKIRYYKLIEDLYNESLLETIFYYSNKSNVHAGKSVDLFYE